MIDWKNKKHRFTAQKVMQFLAYGRMNKGTVISKLNNLRKRNPEKYGDKIYKSNDRIKELIDEMLIDLDYPIRKSNDGNFLERTDEARRY